MDTDIYLYIKIICNIYLAPVLTSHIERQPRKEKYCEWDYNNFHD